MNSPIWCTFSCRAHRGLHLVIVRYFDVVGIVITPNEADPKLVVHADPVLSLPIPFKLFQPIPRRDSQIFQVPSRIQHREFSLCNSRGRRHSSLAGFPDFRRFFCGETLYHLTSITETVNNVNRYYAARLCCQRAPGVLYSFAK